MEEPNLRSTKIKRRKRVRLAYNKGFIIQPKFSTSCRQSVFERKAERGNPAHRVSLQENYLNFFFFKNHTRGTQAHKHTRRNFERQLCSVFKRVTEGGWTFLFKLANYQTITGTFANSYTLEDIVVKNSWNINFFKYDTYCNTVLVSRSISARKISLC